MAEPVCEACGAGPQVVYVQRASDGRMLMVCVKCARSMKTIEPEEEDLEEG